MREIRKIAIYGKGGTAVNISITVSNGTPFLIKSSLGNFFEKKFPKPFKKL